MFVYIVLILNKSILYVRNIINPVGLTSATVKQSGAYGCFS